MTLTKLTLILVACVAGLGGGLAQTLTTALELIGKE